MPTFTQFLLVFVDWPVRLNRMTEAERHKSRNLHGDGKSVDTNSIVSIPWRIPQYFRYLKNVWKNFLKIFSTLFAFGFFEFWENFLEIYTNFNELYRNSINFIIINAKFSQKFSKFFLNILKILFKIFF